MGRDQARWARGQTAVDDDDDERSVWRDDEDEADQCDSNNRCEMGDGSGEAHGRRSDVDGLGSNEEATTTTAGGGSDGARVGWTRGRLEW